MAFVMKFRDDDAERDFTLIYWREGSLMEMTICNCKASMHEMKILRLRD